MAEHKIVESVAQLRKVSDHANNDRVMVRPSRDVYIYEAGNPAADDGNLVLKPDNVLPAQTGRWVRIIMDGSDVETSLTGQANKIPLGDGTNKLDPSWIPPVAPPVETDPVFLSQKGQPNGVATLDGSGKVPSSQLPPPSVFGNNRQTASADPRTTTTSPSFQSKVSVVTPVLTGTYRVRWEALADTPSPTRGEVRLLSALFGVIGPVNVVMNQSSGERKYVGGSADIALAAQSDTLTLQYRDDPPGGDTIGLSAAKIEIFRVL